jgi:hypothetical protein
LARAEGGSAIGPARNWHVAPVEEIVQRATAIMGSSTPAVVFKAVMGGEQMPASHQQHIIGFSMRS